MTGWQGMNTAPKDGTSVLVVEDGQYFVAWWSAGWTRAGDDYNLVVEPTHWQPLPPYPHAPAPNYTSFISPPDPNLNRT